MNAATRAGIDIGSTRIRIAIARRRRGRSLVDAVAVRELPTGACEGGAVREPDLVAALVEEMRAELRWSGRGCICAVGAPAAAVREAAFPRMSAAERGAAARIEAERRVGEQARRDVVVRVHPAGKAGSYNVGVVDRNVLISRTRALRAAGLNVIAVDQDAFALLRCHDSVDAVLDAGLERTALHAGDRRSASSWWTPIGGAAITADIARELSIGDRDAESRKRLHGSNGCADAAVSELFREIEALVAAARRRYAVARIALVGNASRLVGFRSRLAKIQGLSVADELPRPLESSAFPQDVARAGVPDWSVALGLSLWNG